MKSTMEHKIKHSLIVLIAAIGLSACPAPRAKYVDSNMPDTLNTNFNMYDLQSVSTNMTQDLINKRALDNCNSYTVSPVANKTDQYIDTATVSQNIVTQLYQENDLRAKYVVSDAQMKNQEDELKRQQNSKLYNQKTTAKAGQMVGASCRLDGFISNMTSKSVNKGKTKLVNYQIDMKLYNVATGEMLWANRKMISKVMKN